VSAPRPALPASSERPRCRRKSARLAHVQRASPVGCERGPVDAFARSCSQPRRSRLPRARHEPQRHPPSVASEVTSFGDRRSAPPRARSPLPPRPFPWCKRIWASRTLALAQIAAGRRAARASDTASRTSRSARSSSPSFMRISARWLRLRAWSSTGTGLREQHDRLLVEPHRVGGITAQLGERWRGCSGHRRGTRPLRPPRQLRASSASSSARSSSESARYTVASPLAPRLIRSFRPTSSGSVECLLGVDARARPVAGPPREHRELPEGVEPPKKSSASRSASPSLMSRRDSAVLESRKAVASPRTISARPSMRRLAASRASRPHPAPSPTRRPGCRPAARPRGPLRSAARAWARARPLGAGGSDRSGSPPWPAPACPRASSADAAL
jgi:hypothetical protein